MENLLKARFKVIATYPDSNQPLNSLLIQIGDTSRFENNVNGCKIRFFSIQKYPHIFEKMQWWEDRKAEEMPRFLKHKLIDSEYTYHKISEWLFHYKAPIGMIEPEGRENGWCDLGLWSDEYNYQPATEEEYNAYVEHLRNS